MKKIILPFFLLTIPQQVGAICLDCLEDLQPPTFFEQIVSIVITVTFSLAAIFLAVDFYLFLRHRFTNSKERISSLFILLSVVSSQLHRVFLSVEYGIPIWSYYETITSYVLLILSRALLIPAVFFSIYFLIKSIKKYRDIPHKKSKNEVIFNIIRFIITLLAILGSLLLIEEANLWYLYQDLAK